jgi:hypothetical protein
MTPPPFVKLGRKIVYLKDDLDTWLLKHRSDLATGSVSHV